MRVKGSIAFGHSAAHLTAGHMVPKVWPGDEGLATGGQHSRDYRLAHSQNSLGSFLLLPGQPQTSHQNIRGCSFISGN